MSATGEMNLTLDSNRVGYDVEVSAEGLDAAELESILGEDATVDDGSVVVENVEGSLPVNFSAADVDADEYDFTVEATDTDASANASIEVTEVPAPSAEFSSSEFSEEVGDTATMTVDMEGTDSAVVTIESDEGNYWADLLVTAPETRTR